MLNIPITDPCNPDHARALDLLSALRRATEAAEAAAAGAARARFPRTRDALTARALGYAADAARAWSALDTHAAGADAAVARLHGTGRALYERADAARVRALYL